MRGDKQRGFINQIREKLEPSSDETSIRIIGSPGSGKTRIAYEIANKPELSPLILYFENPNDVYDKNFLSRLLESNSYAILIVDECDEYEDRKLRDRVTPHSSRIKLITIDNEQKNGRVYELPQLDEHTITKIISGYNIPEETSIRYAPWCTPSPRLANWVGKNLRTDPNFSIFSEDEIYNRFIAGRLQPDSPEFNNRKHVLMWISLFVKVGFNDPYSGELQGLAKKVKQRSGVPEESFFDIVHQLHRIKLLQGHSTLYITPRSLQFWLWREWWQSYGAGFDLEKFMCVDESTDPPTYFPKSMQERFFAMFRHAPESSNVMRVVRSFLSINGLLEKNELLETGMGARLFSALAETEPRLALNLLNRTVGKWDRQKLLNFGEGRRELLWSLEDLVHEVKNFHDAAKILLRLAAAENEDVANNATGIFAELFSMPPIELARTEASIDVRLNFLRKVLASSDKEERMCALKACDKALESLHFERIDYRHSRILTLTAENWKPGQREISAYQKVIENICSMLDKMDPDEQQEAIHIILNRARALTRLEPLARPFTDKINELYQKPYANKEEIISAVESVVYYDQEKLDSTIIDLWKKLKNNFQRNDYHSLMKRYVEMNILTDDFDENNRRAGIIETQIKKLTHRSLRSRKKLLAELNWICTSKAKNAHIFGFELGQADVHFSLLDDVFSTQPVDKPNYSPSFLGNYLTALFQKDVERWESVLDSMAADPSLCRYVTQVTGLSGMTDKAGLRILGLYERGIIQRSDFAVFIYRTVLRNLSDVIFLKWMNVLLNTSDVSIINTALALFESYYIGSNSGRLLPVEATLCLITHDLLLKECTTPKYTLMDKFYWTNITTKFIELFPKNAITLLDIFLKNIANKNNIFSGHGDQSLEIFDVICKLTPARVWGVIQKYIEPPLNPRSYEILTWLGGSERNSQTASSFTLIPLEQIFAWIDAAPDRRARHLAKFIPKILFDENKCMLRNFLAKYGDMEDVRDQLHNHFLSGGWIGSGVEHYTRELEKYIEFKIHERNQLVLEWIDNHIEILKREIEKEKAVEERLC